jgi:hypothetical protein
MILPDKEFFSMRKTKETALSNFSYLISCDRRGISNTLVRAEMTARRAPLHERTARDPVAVNHDGKDFEMKEGQSPGSARRGVVLTPPCRRR